LNGQSTSFFIDGGPEDQIKWLIGYRDFETSMPLKKPQEKTKILRTLLKCRSLSQFEYFLWNRYGDKHIEIPDSDLLEIGTEDVDLE
jgi:hypothetical protein